VKQLSAFISCDDCPDYLREAVSIAIDSITETINEPIVGKVCTRCGAYLPIDSFGKLSEGKNGYRPVCKQCTREDDRKWRAAHREKEQSRHKQYRSEHKAQMKEYAQKRREDPILRLSDQARQTIWQSFHRKGYRKDTKSAALTGLSSADLTDYLLGTYAKTYGCEWDGIIPVHIDHIVPLSTAESIEDVKRLCYYTNLQLLKAHDNLQKSARLDYKIG